LLQKNRAVKDILAVLQHIEARKLAKNTSGKLKERSAYFLPPYASQSQLAVMISCRTFTACGLGNEEWRPLVGMLCFGNQAKIWNWLRVFRRADAMRLGHGVRQERQREQCRQKNAWHDAAGRGTAGA
jgi:hypothetical protein